MNTIKIPAAITVVLLLSVTLLGLSFRKSIVTRNNFESGNTTGFAVVELFTSEGCSSCPAADEALEITSKTYKENVYLLGFHVDYWNRLGWKDAFSSAVYSDRQRNYAQVFEKDGVYTPQAIVNGTEQFIGSDLDQLNRTIKKDLLAAVNIAPVISVTSVNNNAVVSYSIKEDRNLVLNIALVQLHAVTNVKNGENEGRTLSHINIVRDFKTVDANNASGKVNLIIPAGMAAIGFKVIAYLQHRSTFQTTGAVEVALK
jgi:hypothetical protein